MLSDREQQIAGFAYSCGIHGKRLDEMAGELEAAEAAGTFDPPAETNTRSAT